MLTKTILGFIALCAGLVLLPQPTLAAVKWSVSGCTGTTFGNGCSLTPSAGTITAGATGWSTTANAGTGTNNALGQAYIASYSGGLGVTNADGSTTVLSPPDSNTTGCGTDGTGIAKDCAEGTPGVTVAPEHAVDNNGRYDSILFTFTDKVNLTQVQVGYPTEGSTTCSVTGGGSVTCDSDIMVFAYTGPGGSPSVGGQVFSQATMTGWSLVGSYANVVTSTSNTANVSTGYSSQYWMVAAYDPLWSTGGSCTAVPTNFSCGDDYVKILSVSGNTPGKVPEPGTLLLLGIAATAGAWGRKRGARRAWFPRTLGMSAN